MMPVADLEATLRAAVAAQGELYRQALVQARDLASDLNADTDASKHLAGFVKTLDEVARVEASVADLKRCWTSLRQPPSPDTRQVLDAAACMLEELLVEIARAEQKAASHMQTLGPALATAAKSQRAMRVYAVAAQDSTSS
jgi:hypothetical protein